MHIFGHFSFESLGRGDTALEPSRLYWSPHPFFLAIFGIVKNSISDFVHDMLELAGGIVLDNIENIVDYDKKKGLIVFPEKSEYDESDVDTANGKQFNFFHRHYIFRVGKTLQQVLCRRTLVVRLVEPLCVPRSEGVPRLANRAQALASVLKRVRNCGSFVYIIFKKNAQRLFFGAKVV